MSITRKVIAVVCIGCIVWGASVVYSRVSCNSKMMDSIAHEDAPMSDAVEAELYKGFVFNWSHTIPIDASSFSCTMGIHNADKLSYMDKAMVDCISVKVGDIMAPLYRFGDINAPNDNGDGFTYILVLDAYDQLDGYSVNGPTMYRYRVDESTDWQLEISYSVTADANAITYVIEDTTISDTGFSGTMPTSIQLYATTRNAPKNDTIYGSWTDMEINNAGTQKKVGTFCDGIRLTK